MEKVKEASSLAGMGYTAYFGYSFCIGAAKTAAKHVINDTTIKTLGVEEQRVQGLHKTTREQLASCSHHLGDAPTYRSAKLWLASKKEVYCSS